MVSPRALFGLLVLAPHLALAAAYQVEARTEAQLYSFRAWRSGPVDRPTLIPRRRLVQSLGLNAYELVTGQPLGFEASLRVVSDFGLPKEEADRLDGVRTVDADLLYANIIYQGEVLGVRLGRQTYVDVMDFVAFDGALVRVSAPLADDLLRLGGEVYAGLWVKGAGAIAGSNYQPDGIRESDLRRVQAFEAPPYGALDDIEPLVGAKLKLENLKGLSAAVAFRQAWLSGKTDLQRLAVEARFGRGLGFNLVGGLEYDLLLARISNSRAQVRYDGEILALSAEYARVSPVLSADSVFLYFAHMPRDAARLRVDFYPFGPLRFHAQAQGDLYHDNINPDSALFAAMQDPALPAGVGFGAGGGAALKAGPFRAALDVSFKTGFGGGQVWGDLTAGWAPRLPVSVDARLSYAHLTDALNPSLRGSFWGGQLWAGYQFTRTARFSAAVEQNFNPYTRSDTKVFLLLDLKANI